VVVVKAEIQLGLLQELQTQVQAAAEVKLLVPQVVPES
jgi:hypothetical protein